MATLTLLGGACAAGDEAADAPSSTSSIDAAATPAATTVRALAGRPADLAYADGVLWVVEDETGAVQRFDAATGAPLGGPVLVAGAPASVAVGGGTIWLADAVGALTRIDAASATVVGPPIPVGRSLVDVVVDGDAIWVVDIGLGSVRRLDGQGATIWETQVPGGAVRAVTAGDRLWVSGIEDTVVALGLATGQVLGAPVRVGAGPIGMAASPEVLWVANSDDDTVSRLDPVTGVPLGPAVAVGGAPIAVAVDGDVVWVLAQDGRALTRLDAGTGRRLSPDVTLPLRPRSFAVTPAGVWVIGVDLPSAVLVPRS